MLEKMNLCILYIFPKEKNDLVINFNFNDHKDYRFNKSIKNK